MGTSLADRAWGRESAVYRVTGVITVITGWFFTAFLAFTASFLIANLINWGGFVAIIMLIVLTLLLAIRTHRHHKKKTQKEEPLKDETGKLSLFENEIFTTCSKSVIEVLESVNTNYSQTINGLIAEDRKALKKTNKKIIELNLKAKELKDDIPITLSKLPADSIEIGHFYIQELDYLREVAHCLTFISQPAYKHVDNNHKALIPDQAEELTNLASKVDEVIQKILLAIKQPELSNVEEIIELQQSVLEFTDQYRKSQLKRLKAELVGTRNSLLFIALLHETKNLLLHLINLTKSHRDFVHNQIK